MRAPTVVNIVALLAAVVVVTTGCPPAAEDTVDGGVDGGFDPGEGEGEGEPGEGEGEGEGEPGEGEGEGEGEVTDAGPDPDPDVVGLDARPANTDCAAPARPVIDSTFSLVEPYPLLQLDNPLFLTERPGDDEHYYVMERGGRIVRFDKSNANAATPEVWCDLRDRVSTSDNGNSEQGLLGMAFSPDDGDELYVSYTADNDNDDCPFTGSFSCFFESRVSRLVVDDASCNRNSEAILLDIDDFAGNHNGGHILFDHDGYLMLGMGDGGSANDPLRAGQDTQTLLGKMIRIDVSTTSTGRPYGIPSDNPFVGAADPNDDVLDEIWATGMRNPWRFSFDKDSGELWVGDVGQNILEEIDLVQPGGNYGWSTFEGTRCFRGDAACNDGGFIGPVVEYAHGNGRVSITGGYVYRGDDVPNLRGTYLFADFASKEIFTLDRDDDGTASFSSTVTMSGGGIASFAETNDGEVWVIDLGGALWRIAPPAQAPAVDTFPQRLSDTGCVDVDDPSVFGSSTVPYGLNMPFYSDNAAKERAVAMPDGSTAHVEDDGDISFPVGTVFLKQFRVADALVETRLLVRHDDGEWAGYSYAWNDDGSDAVLVDPAGKTKTLSTGQQWIFPSRAGCMGCHTAAAGRVLGPEVGQLNGGFTYPQTDRFANQLTTWSAIGLLDAPLSAEAIAAAPKYPPLNLASVDVAERGAAYLHVNCAMCHRPDGGGQSEADFRLSTGLANASVCDVAPSEGSFGVADARVFAPGDPARSMIAVRMRRLGAGRMPLFGSTVVDTLGVDVVERWIEQTTACPAP